MFERMQVHPLWSLDSGSAVVEEESAILLRWWSHMVAREGVLVEQPETPKVVVQTDCQKRQAGMSTAPFASERTQPNPTNHSMRPLLVSRP
jgi:hypothetical protein